jgi:hypothetical protein
MSHTPGPWAAERVWKSWQSELYTPSPEEPDHYMKRPITAIRSLTTHKCVALADDLFEFEPANARLIAAAPELLATTKECADALADIINAAGNGQPYSADELVELFADIRCRADAAYEKATGVKA